MFLDHSLNIHTSGILKVQCRTLFGKKVGSGGGGACGMFAHVTAMISCDM